MNDYSKPVGMLAFIWRLTLTTGTGSIFGFLVAREAYNSAIIAPMFSIMSFEFGLAIFLMVLMAGMRWTGRELGDVVFPRPGSVEITFAGSLGGARPILSRTDGMGGRTTLTERDESQAH